MERFALRIPLIGGMFIQMEMDEVVGHMTERVVIPPADQIEITPRRYTTKKPGEYHIYEPSADLVPDMVKVGG